MKLSLSKSLHRQKARFSFWFSITLLFVPLEWALASGSPPSVDAGPARVLAFPAKDLTLLGHATDPENDPLTVIWTMINGPAPVKFSAPWALATTVSFATTGAYTFQLAVSDSTSNVTSNVTVTVNPASSQTAFYVDPTYTGATENGSPSAPWKSLLDSDNDFTAKWMAIRNALASNDVIIYFSARTAGADVSEQFLVPSGARLFIDRACRGGTSNCPGPGDTSTHRLTLDGMSLYNTNDATPSWAAYSGANKFKINCASTCGSMSIGWDDDNQRDYVTIRGFEVTGPGSRIRWGGSYSVLEYMWVHDVTVLGATVQFNAAVSDYPACRDFGKSHDITVRNNLIESGYDEGLYLAGTYNYTTYGGCPSYGNTHSDILIEGNTIHDPGANGGEGDGMDLKMGLMNVTVRNNVIMNPINACEGGAINSPGVFAPAKTNYLIEGNRISGGTDRVGCNFSGGISLGGQNGTVIRNNVIYNTPESAAINLEGDTNFPNNGIEVYNNTIFGNAGGIAISYTNTSILRNNLVFGNRTGLQMDWDGTGSINSDYNLMAPQGAGFSEGTHSIVQAATSGLVANPAGGDFHLVAGSPAIDKGLDLSFLANLAAGVTAFNQDFDGVTRPQGPAWDVGAYEFLSGGPDFTISVTPRNATVKAGQSATLAVSVIPTGGYNASTTFSCSGLPALASCAFSPATLTPSGAAVSTNLVISTTVARASLQAPGMPGQQQAPRMPFSLASLGLFALLLAKPAKRGKGQLPKLLVLTFMIAAATAALVGCAARSTNASGSGTPPGTSQVTVTALSPNGAVSHSIVVTLNVN